MKKSICLYLLFLIIINFSGCKKTEPESSQTFATNTETIESNLPSGQADKTVSDSVQTTFDQPVDSTDESIDTEINITEIDLSNWYGYDNIDYGFSFHVPSEYAVFEVMQGRFQITGNNEGDFFEVRIEPELESTLHAETPISTANVTINGIDFIREEYREGDSRQIAYFSTYNGNEFRIMFYYTDDYDDYLLLFNRVMQTFKFI